MAGKLYYLSWIQVATTPYGSALDASKLFWPVALPRKSQFRAAKMKAIMLEGSVKENITQDKSFDVSISVPKIIIGADSEKSVIHTRVITATSLGIFASKMPEASLQVVIDSLWNDLISSSGVQRQVKVHQFSSSLFLLEISVVALSILAMLTPMFALLKRMHMSQVASMVFVAWFKELKSRNTTEGVFVGLLDNVKQWLLDLLLCSDPSFPTKASREPYAELSRTYTKMRNEASHLFHLVESIGIFKDYISSIKFNLKSLTVDEAINFASNLSLPIESTVVENVEKHIVDDIESSKQQLLSTSAYLKCVQVHGTVSFIRHFLLYFDLP